MDFENHPLNNVNVRKPFKNNVINVKATASKLVDRLDDPDSYKYFCKVAWSLPESVIWNNLEQALGGRNPKAYFTFLCNLAMQ